MSHPNFYRRSNVVAVSLSLIGLIVIAALASLPFLAGKPEDSNMPDIVKFIGRFHPVVLHLPIGLLTWVIIMEIGNFFSKKPEKSSSHIAIFFTACSAVLAALLGFLLYYSMPDYDKELVERHLVGGIILACTAVAAFVVKTWVDAKGGYGTFFYQFLLVSCAGVMTFTSHDGASLTHGKTYLTEFAPTPLRKAMGLPTEDKERPKTKLADPIIYADVIAPILEQKCYSCHNTEKKKGKYQMDEYDLLLAGGTEGDGIVPGKSADSNVIIRVNLPVSDDEHMPPEGKKELAEHEIVLLKWWIDGGASKDAKIPDLPMSDEVKNALAKTGNPSEKAGASHGEKKTSFNHEAMKADVIKLRGIFPTALNYESQISDNLVFTAVGIRKKFGDADLAKLKPVLPAITTLDLSATEVTDSGVKILEKATDLRSLRLSETAVTDTSLDFIKKLPHLESLNLFGTRTSNAGILKLASMTQLKKLYLWRTDVDAAGIKAFSEKLPSCEILTGL